MNTISMNVAAGRLYSAPRAGDADVYIGPVCLTGEHFVLAGRCSRDFELYLQTPTGSFKSEIAFFCTNSERSFIAVLSAPHEENIALAFRMGVSETVVSLKMSQFEKTDLARICSLVPQDELWRLSQCFTKFSKDWNTLLHRIPINIIMSLDAAGSDGDAVEVISRLKAICADLDYEGWQGAVDGCDGVYITGWANHTTATMARPIDIYVNGYRLAHEYLPNLLRSDLRDAGIGDGRRGFRVALDHNCFTSDLLAITLRDPGTGKIFAWRFCLFTAGAVALKGAIDHYGDVLDGWFITEDAPDRLLEIGFYIDGTLLGYAFNDRRRDDLKIAGMTSGRGGFSIAAPCNLLSPGAHTLRLEFYGGRHSREFQFTSPARPAAPLRNMAILERQVTIIIPCLSNSGLGKCLESILRHTRERFRIIIVKAGCPTIESANILHAYAAHPAVTIIPCQQLHNWSAVANAGIAAAGCDDVVILQESARVMPGWLRSMLLTAASAPHVGMVMAVGDSVGVLPHSSPAREFSGTDLECDYARAFRRASFGCAPLALTSHSPCVYMSRACLHEVGLFKQDDGEHLARAVLDFCLRAFKAGWDSLLDDRTYVFADGCVPSVEMYLPGSEAGGLNEAHPEYANLRSAQQFSRMHLVKFSAAYAAKHLARLARTRLLFVNNIAEGGTHYTNLDLMRSFQDIAQCYLLQSDSRTLRLFLLQDGDLVLVRQHVLRNSIDPIRHASLEADVVMGSWIVEYDIELVHIRNLIWNSLGLIATAKLLGCRVIYSFHDFYAMSPNVKLVDDAGVFMGSDFLPQGSGFRETLWRRYGYACLPIHASGFAQSWKRRFCQALGNCDAFVTTSESAREVIIEEFPELDREKLFVIPHGRDFSRMANLKSDYVSGERIRILLLNAKASTKGGQILEALAEYDAGHLNILEFHGAGSPGPQREHFIQHGVYERDGLANLVAGIRPHLAAIFSVWCETWCHTLTECWAMGLPVMVFDLGAQAERTRATGCGWVLDMEDIPQLYNSIIAIATNVAAQKPAQLAVSRWQAGLGIANTTRLMALRYYQLYRQLLVHGTAARAEVQRQFIVLCVPDGSTPDFSAIQFAKGDFRHEVDYLQATPAQLAVYLEQGMVAAIFIQGIYNDRGNLSRCIKLAKELNVPVHGKFAMANQDQNAHI